MVTTRGSNFDANTCCRRVSIQCNLTIQTHMAQLMSTKGLPPQIAQMIVPNAIAHLQQHYAEQYRVQMMQKLGGPLPPIPHKPQDVQSLPQEIEDEIAVLAGQASQEIMQQMQQSDPE